MLITDRNTRQEIIDNASMLIAKSMLAEHKNAAFVNTDPHQETSPLPGNIWPGHGGVYMGIMRSEQHYWHLILAVDPMSIFNGEWGAEGTSITGCDSLTDGLANTEAMIKSSNKHPIVEQLAEFNKTGQDGHTDFYLPAIRENNLINIYAHEHVEKVYHWSSTQDDAGYAWCQDFENGYQYIYCKDDERAARAVRRILIIE